MKMTLLKLVNNTGLISEKNLCYINTELQLLYSIPEIKEFFVSKKYRDSFKPPRRIRTLKYLEMKIEEWPSRAKWGQAGSNRTKWCQMVPNRVKRGQMGSNGAKNGQKVPYRAKPGQKGQRGQTRPNGVIWG